MLNMQNVKDIEITEGAVRTIHDKDNRLIWGRLAYDTKYAGDTYQQTYSGANLFNVNTITPPTGATINADGSITCVYDNTSGSSTHFMSLYPANLDLQTSTTYAAFAEIISLTGRGTLAVISGNSSASQFTNNKTFNLADYQTGDIIKTTDTTKANFSGTNAGTRTYVSVQAGLSLSLTFRMSVIADTTVTPEDFVYQPYTGGIPAPSPSYPMPISVVTGVQTVTVSDGTLSKVFTVDLGATELCKIGTYQDKIYNNDPNEDWYDPDLEDNAWYVHKEVDKYVFGGDESWQTTPYGTNSWILSNVIYFNFVSSKIQIMSNLATGIAHADRNTTTPNVMYSGQNNVFNYRNTSFTTLSALQTATKDSYVYYALATPTDTKITDATLIGQLNAIHEWLTRYGYNATVSGNLPIIINKTNL